MKITLCGSIAFIDEMDAVRKELETMGHEVQMPPLEIVDDTGKTVSVKEHYVFRKSIVDGSAAAEDYEWVWKKRANAMRNHFDKVAWADATLVCNYDKNDITGYVGANTLMEMGLAFHLKQPIYLLNSIPEISYKEEILGMWPIVIDGDLKKIT
jgi:uncharacterized protein YccT (UPF0319 family)